MSAKRAGIVTGRRHASLKAGRIAVERCFALKRENPRAFQPRAARQLVHSADHGASGDVGERRRPAASRRSRESTKAS